jgi:flagellar biosynthesis protein FlhB
MIKYEKEINKFLRDLFYENWMTEDEFNEIISESFKRLNTNIEKLNNDIEIGIKNGYSIETQFELVKIFFKI